MTFSITARCERTNQLGIAISTKLPAVGALCPFAKAGYGAISTQSFINPYIGINGLDYLEAGLNAEEVLEKVLAEDPDPEKRQVGIVDADGGSAAFTGSECDGWYGHLTGDNYAVAGNMLVGEETIHRMEETFKNTEGEPLAERLMASLEAGQDAGGDKRGRQSAALLVVDKEKYPRFDIRVDDHADPVAELRRIHTVTVNELTPLMMMLPTLDNPKGAFDLEDIKARGMIKDEK